LTVKPTFEISLALGLIPIDQKAIPDLVAQKDVLVDRHFRDEGQFLIDDGDPGVVAVGNASKLLHLSVVQDIAGIGAVRIDPAEHLHQGGFAGAILADKTVNLPLGHLEAHVVQGFDAGELLGDVLHLQDWAGHGFICSSVGRAGW
jgi:hypothetical protein